MTPLEITLAEELGGYKALYQRAERERQEAVAEVARLRALVLDEVTVLEDAAYEASKGATTLTDVVENVVQRLADGRYPAVTA